MKIERFYDTNLSHASYAILSNNEIALVDPSRDPQPYYEFAVKNKAKIKAVIETHPHADFVSSHLEISRETDAAIYASNLFEADFEYKPFDDGKEIQLGQIILKAINTPGHSPESISVLMLDENGQEHAIFTGDTVFIGEVGRPDLREDGENISAKKETLAKQMFQTIHTKLKDIKDETIVFPAHGAGSLCGRNLSTEASGTIGNERKNNWAFRQQTEGEFVQHIIQDQPFIPKYFSYAVSMNKKGAPAFETSIHAVDRLTEITEIPSSQLIVDVRNEKEFKQGHFPNSINIMVKENDKFETWLGSVIDPSEKFYLIASSEEQLEQAVSKAAKIGYEKLILGAVPVNNSHLPKITETLDVKQFSNDLDEFSIVDVRNEEEVKKGKYFKNAIAIPLHELREKAYKIPTDKPVVVHCAAGYRSAVGSSILENKLSELQVFDLGDAIEGFK